MNEVYDRVNASGEIVGRGVRTIVEGPSLAKQSMKDECDINKIMKKFERTGLITHNAIRQAYFADVSEVPDFAAAVDVVRKATDMFMSLPAKLRARFENDPSKYVEFTANPANLEEMRSLGLVEMPKPKAVPVEVIVTNPAAPVDKPVK